MVELDQWNKDEFSDVKAGMRLQDAGQISKELDVRALYEARKQEHIEEVYRAYSGFTNIKSNKNGCLKSNYDRSCSKHHLINKPTC